MNIQDAKIGQEVVRSKGDYVVGRVGIIIAIEDNRAQVKWELCATTKVSLNAIELTSIPYEIIPATTGRDRFGYPTHTHPKYKKL